MQVRSLMTTELITVTPETLFLNALNKMSTSKLSCLIAVEGGAPVGIVTERDMVMRFLSILESNNAHEVSVGNIMTCDPVCVTQECKFEEALTLSRSRKLRHLPVVDENHKLVGLVTQTNLINAYSQLMEHQDKLEYSVKQLEALSLEDPLMKIGNRRAMEVDLAFTDAESKRHDKAFSLALLDIDFFKKYNDLYGHQRGDDALRQVADIIKVTIRDSDRVFRYGGEEILILMPETNDEAALLCADRVRQAIEDAKILHENAPLGVLTVSAGVAFNNCEGWKSMIGLADKALYRSKEQGRNQINTAR